MKMNLTDLTRNKLPSSHRLCRNFQASSQNFTIYGGVWCNW